MSFQGKCASVETKWGLGRVEKSAGLRGQHIGCRIKNAVLQVGQLHQLRIGYQCCERLSRLFQITVGIQYQGRLFQ